MMGTKLLLLSSMKNFVMDMLKKEMMSGRFVRFKLDSFTASFNVCNGPTSCSVLNINWDQCVLCAFL